MEKLWAGRACGTINEQADDFNSSIRFDSKMYQQDIKGSMAHAAMLGATGIVTEKEARQIIDGLQSVLDDIESGKLPIDMKAEDIHTFVEAELTARIGEPGKRLHTARSRNDQVAVDIRLYLRDKIDETIALLYNVIKAVKDKAKQNAETIMPGYTHLQRAQPVTFGHYILSYCMMFMRDVGRLKDARARMNVSPLGSCALAGTTYPIDRDMTAVALGFDAPCLNSIDGVSDRDFTVELMSALSLIMTHLSRFSEEIILWSSREFSFTEPDDSFTTGSSIMPQKKNPDIAELVRGKTGRVYGDLFAMLTTLKGLPLAYNKDMQEDKEQVFDAFDTVIQCLTVFAPMIATLKVNQENMYKASQTGFINATDLADYLVSKGLPFRTAYKLVGGIVRYCIDNDKVLETMTLEEYKTFDGHFDTDLYAFIDLHTCVEKRISAGGTGFSSVYRQIEAVEKFLGEMNGSVGI